MAWKRLSLPDRDEIAFWAGAGLGVREIARRTERSPSTISRELRRNRSGSPPGYRAAGAQARANRRSGRPRPRKLAAGTPLRAVVVRLLALGWSPGQIAGRLKRDYPGRPEMQVSHETIYQALFVQGKGSLRAEVQTAVRCGRVRRKPRSRTAGLHDHIPGMVSVSERPAEAQDRAVPGHWESQWCCQAA